MACHATPVPERERLEETQFWARHSHSKRAQAHSATPTLTPLQQAKISIVLMFTSAPKSICHHIGCSRPDPILSVCVHLCPSRPNCASANSSIALFGSPPQAVVDMLTAPHRRAPFSNAEPQSQLPHTSHPSLEQGPRSRLFNKLPGGVRCALPTSAISSL